MQTETSALANIRVVLVETSHTGNMGSAARAMKTMGIEQLYLVNPLLKPDSQAVALAAGASDIVRQAVICDSLDEAIADCRLVVGTSARSRSLQWPFLTARECGEKLVQEAADAPVALVFGRERVGLTNEELQKCHYHVAIPANPAYSSLNLAMSVQILCYEARMAALAQTSSAEPKSQTVYPQAADVERFYQHLQQILEQVEFIKAEHPGQVMNRLRRLYSRARIEQGELNILRGVLAAIEQRLKSDS